MSPVLRNLALSAILIFALSSRGEADIPPSPSNASFPATSRETAAEAKYYEVLLFRYTRESDQTAYTVGLIRRWNGHRDLPLNEHEFADRMLSHLEREKRRVFSERPEYSSDILDEFDDKEGIKDGRSEVVFVSAVDDPTQVYSMVRVVRTTEEHPLLPLEERLKIRLERPPIRSSDLSFGGVFTAGDAPFHAYGAPIGDFMELKNLFQLRDSPEDFVPVMYEVLEETGAALKGKPITSRPGRVIHRGVAIPFTWNYLVPSGYVQECFQSRVRYYRATMGFRQWQTAPDPQAPDGQAHVLKIGRSEFHEMGRTHLKRRPGYSLVSGVRREWRADTQRLIEKWLTSCQKHLRPTKQETEIN